MKDKDTSITDERKQRAFDRVNNLPISKLLGMQLVDIQPNEAVVRIEMRDDLRQPSGVLHGGVTATIIDTAMALAVRTHLEDHEYTTTVNLTVHYLRPHKAGAVSCTAKCVKIGKRIFTVSADVQNEEGMLIATGLSTYARI
ncbi:MAG: PaaI family thioesterase [Pyrinomonadaceae bacterium]